MWDRIKSAGLLVLVAVVALAIGAAAPQALAQEVAPDPFPLRPPDTASPQDTLRSLRQNLLEAMQLWQAQEPGIAFRRARERALRCLDLTELPPAVRVDYGSERAVLPAELTERLDATPEEVVRITIDAERGRLVDNLIKLADRMGAEAQREGLTDQKLAELWENGG